MPTQVSIPQGLWSLPDPRASGRSTTNCLAELSPYGADALTSLADAKSRLPPVYLRRFPGVSEFANDGTSNPVRGAREMGGVQYVVIGPALYSVSSAGLLSQIGTGITGTGLVRMTDNTQCLVILVPGASFCYTYAPVAGSNPNHVATVAGFATLALPYNNNTDCWFCSPYVVFLSQGNGDPPVSVIFNDDGPNGGQLSFTQGYAYARSNGTDPVVGMAVDHNQVLLLGRRTSELIYNGVVPSEGGSPFASLPGSYMDFGMHVQGAYTAALQNQGTVWLTNDRRVVWRAWGSQTAPTRISNHGLESLLEDANLAGCYAFALSLGGHLFYFLTVPGLSLTFGYDFITSEWFKATSFSVTGPTAWRPLCAFTAFGNTYVGDSISGQIGLLDFSVTTEYGNPITSKWTTQSIYSNHERIVHRRLEAVVTPGKSTSFTAGANLTCKVSDDSGTTWRYLPMRSLGQKGAYTTRTVWWNLGQSRDRAYEFELSDPTELFAVDMIAELAGGKF